MYICFIHERVFSGLPMLMECIQGLEFCQELVRQKGGMFLDLNLSYYFIVSDAFSVLLVGLEILNTRIF